MSDDVPVFGELSLAFSWTEPNDFSEFRELSDDDDVHLVGDPLSGLSDKVPFFTDLSDAGALDAVRAYACDTAHATASS